MPQEPVVLRRIFGTGFPCRNGDLPLFMRQPSVKKYKLSVDKAENPESRCLTKMLIYKKTFMRSYGYIRPDGARFNQSRRGNGNIAKNDTIARKLSIQNTCTKKYEMCYTTFMKSSESSEPVISPVYLRIAQDIALRIAQGELKENTKIYGRSVMSSEYGVSPETIRRALNLLADMDVVEIRQNSGAVILSSENARTYIEKFNEYTGTKALQKQLKKIVAEHTTLTKQMLDLVNSIAGSAERFSLINPLPNYDIEVPPTSPVIGKTVAELRFWQETGATIIAIRRDGKLILSPGPYIQILSGDTIIFVGDTLSTNAVHSFILQENQDQLNSCATNASSQIQAET